MYTLAYNDIMCKLCTLYARTRATYTGRKKGAVGPVRPAVALYGKKGGGGGRELIDGQTIRSDDGDGFDLCASIYLCGATHVIIIISSRCYFNGHLSRRGEIERSVDTVRKGRRRNGLT